MIIEDGRSNGSNVDNGGWHVPPAEEATKFVFTCLMRQLDKSLV
jgi:hypothetical protein